MGKNMNVLFDVWVNWVAGECSGVNIPYHFEWTKDDTVQLIDTVPYIHIEKDLFTYIENGYEHVEIPKELLDSVYQKALVYDKNRSNKKMIDYLFAITDGDRTLVINTDGTNKPVLKSRMLIRQDAYLIDIIKDKEPASFEFTNNSVDSDVEVEVHGLEIAESLLDPSPECFIGLTRIEKDLKMVLLDCLYHISCSEDKYEHIYWYTEIFPDKYPEVTKGEVNSNDLINEMYEFLKVGWNKTHVEFGKAVIKRYSIFEEVWDELIKEKNKEVARMK